MFINSKLFLCCIPLCLCINASAGTIVSEDKNHQAFVEENPKVSKLFLQKILENHYRLLNPTADEIEVSYYSRFEIFELENSSSYRTSAKEMRAVGHYEVVITRGSSMEGQIVYVSHTKNDIGTRIDIRPNQ